MAELPDVPELAVVCTPAPTVPGVIAELGRRGTRAAIVISAGLEQASAEGQTLGEAMLMALKDVAVSSGSACTSASLEPSYVLRALGVAEEMAHTSIRFGIGRFNTEEEVDYVIDLVVGKINKLRELSPLYEMAQAGIDLKSIQWAAH